MNFWIMPPQKFWTAISLVDQYVLCEKTMYTFTNHNDHTYHFSGRLC